MRIFSGIQPTGQMHIGNYAGAVSQWLALQKNPDNTGLFCIVDLHALTNNPAPDELSINIRETIESYLAFGLGNSRFRVFVQSHVSAHVQLAWILNTITGMGELERMTQFKYKANQGVGEKKNTSAGLFTYPTLMASDILLYDTDVVPVGEDQMQHMELTRDIAKRFNHRFGETFIVPRAQISKTGARIMSLQDPAKKMSKSLGSGHYVGIFEPEEVIRKKIMSAVTDSGSEIAFDVNKKPAISNLLTMYSIVTNESVSNLARELKNVGYSAFKEKLGSVYLEFFKEVREKREEISSGNGRELVELKNNTEHVREMAQKKLQEVKKKIGLIY